MDSSTGNIDLVILPCHGAQRVGPAHAAEALAGKFCQSNTLYTDQHPPHLSVPLPRRPRPLRLIPRQHTSVQGFPRRNLFPLIEAAAVSKLAFGSVAAIKSSRLKSSISHLRAEHNGYVSLFDRVHELGDLGSIFP